MLDTVGFNVLADTRLDGVSNPDTMPVREAGRMTAEISKSRWGGPRQNSGGARPGAGRKPAAQPVAEIADPAWTGPRWCVVLTWPQAERSAAYELCRAGYSAYLPMIAIRRRDPVLTSLWHKVLVPRLPGYLFALLDPRDPWAPILHLWHLIRLLLQNQKMLMLLLLILRGVFIIK